MRQAAIVQNKQRGRSLVSWELGKRRVGVSFEAVALSDGREERRLLLAVSL